MQVEDGFQRNAFTAINQRSKLVVKSTSTMWEFGQPKTFEKLPCAWIEHERDSPKINVFCAISNKKVCGPFYFKNHRSSLFRHVDWVIMPHEEDNDDFIWVQGRALPYWLNHVRDYLDKNLQLRWFGHAADMHNRLLQRPPRSPVLTPCNFFEVMLKKKFLYHLFH